MNIYNHGDAPKQIQNGDKFIDKNKKIWTRLDGFWVDCFGNVKKDEMQGPKPMETKWKHLARQWKSKEIKMFKWVGLLFDTIEREKRQQAQDIETKAKEKRSQFITFYFAEKRNPMVPESWKDTDTFRYIDDVVRAHNDHLEWIKEQKRVVEEYNSNVPDALKITIKKPQKFETK